MSSEPTSTPVPVKMPASGVFAFQSVHAEGFETGWMSHPYWKLLLIVRGRGTLRRETGCDAFAGGDLLLLPIGQKHRLIDAPGAPATILALCFTPEALSPAASPCPVTRSLPSGRLEPGPILRREVSGWLRQLLYEQAARPLGVEILIPALVRQLVVAIVWNTPTSGAARDQAGDGADRETSSRAAVAAYATRLERTFFNAGGIDAASAELGLSRRRFTALFRAVTGESYTRYVRRLRVEHAKRLLTGTPQSIPAVAFNCGFLDVSSLYRAFAACGEPPPGLIRRLEPRRKG